MTLYERYIEICPNSILEEGKITGAEMRQHIAAHEYNEAISKGNEVKALTTEQLDFYANWKQGRKYTSFFDFTKKRQSDIKKAIKQYEKDNGKIDKIYLSGSFASGSWLEKKTSKEDRAIRSLHKTEKPFSDIDLIVEPTGPPAMIHGVDFSLVAQGDKVLIYENDTFL